MEKNIFEFLDSLQSEQKQPVIDHFVKKILGKPTPPLILSVCKTISNDASIEERIRLMAETYGIDPLRIDKNEFILGEQQIAESKTRIKEIIKNCLGKENNNGQRSKDDELISLGKFLYTTQMDFQITSTEIPDFILSTDERKIGLEHTRLESGKEKAYIAEIQKKYLKDTEILLLTEMPGLTGVANLSLDNDLKLFNGKSLRDFNDKTIKSNAPIIIRELTNYIMSVIKGTSISKPPFVKAFSFQASSEPFTLKYNQDYFVRNDFTEMVLRGIEKKEKRLNAYRTNGNISECWLLLVYGDDGPSSGFKVFEGSLTISILSKFDRVFILNSFNQACFELENGTSNLKYIARKQFSELSIKPI